MSATFTHLHVASSASLRHGTDAPAALVARAADLGMDALALTDRDALHGAVKHVVACAHAGLAPLLGVDLAVEPLPLGPRDGTAGGPTGARAAPVRGGVLVDPGLPRAVVLARAGAGYAALCRLVSAAHARGEHGRPVASAALVGEHAAGDADEGVLTVLLGPASPVGRATALRRPDVALALLRRWCAALPGGVVVEVVAHPGPPGAPGGVEHAARMLVLARRAGVPAVLTNAVRHARPQGSRLAQVLDASRLLLPLGSPHLPVVTGHAHLASPERMAVLADRVAVAAGESSGARLLAETAAVAQRCRLDPGADLGVGRVHLPEPAALGLRAGQDPDAVLRQRCHAALGHRYPRRGAAEDARRRADAELAVIAELGYARYFLTVAAVCDMVRAMGVRLAARGSGVSSVVNHLVGISAVDPLAHGLVMERFLTVDRADLPDVDLDVEAARRGEVQHAIVARFGAQRVATLTVLHTHRARHAVRTAGAALGLAPAEVDVIAAALPRVRAAAVRTAIAQLPELAGLGLDAERLRELFDLVEALDGLPRQDAAHPCGVLVCHAGLGDLVPLQGGGAGDDDGEEPLRAQYDKDDVEVLGLLKLDVLGVRMQSAIAHAVAEVERTTGQALDVDAVPLDDADTYRLVRSARTLGVFQVESPGQRELVGRFAPQSFADLVVDISLFRPGPVASDMITPFLAARHGWAPPVSLHPRLAPLLAETEGVVVFHEQVLHLLAATAGTTLAIADAARRAMATADGRRRVNAWWRPLALRGGFAPHEADRVWQVLEAFAAFGFCKAHAVAFATTTYRSAWLKAHHPAAFFAGLLTHDPGMYPKRVLLAEARALGMTILPLDVNASGATWHAEPLPGDHDDPGDAGGGPGRGDLPRAPRRRPMRPLPTGHGLGAAGPGQRADAAVPDARGWGLRPALADVAGITDAEVAAIVAGRPWTSLGDLAERARPSRPVLEHLVAAGALDAVHATREHLPHAHGPHGHGQHPRGSAPTRRDLLVALDERARTRPAGTGRGGRGGRAAHPDRADQDQAVLDLGDPAVDVEVLGLRPMDPDERVRAEVAATGLDVSRHLLAGYAPMLAAAGAVRSTHLVHQRAGARVLVAGVRIAVQTPPVRSGARVLFVSLDDGAGAVDATFFSDAQRAHAATVLACRLLVIGGSTRRTGARGVSLRAQAAWDLPALWQRWRQGGTTALSAALDEVGG